MEAGAWPASGRWGARGKRHDVLPRTLAVLDALRGRDLKQRLRQTDVSAICAAHGVSRQAVNIAKRGAARRMCLALAEAERLMDTSGPAWFSLLQVPFGAAGGSAA